MLTDDYRAEYFAACDGEEPPCWISLEAQDGSQRTEAQALALVTTWMGEPEEGYGFSVKRVAMHVGRNEYGDLNVNKEPFGETEIGVYDFWEIEETFRDE